MCAISLCSLMNCHRNTDKKTAFSPIPSAIVPFTTTNVIVNGGSNTNGNSTGAYQAPEPMPRRGVQRARSNQSLLSQVFTQSPPIIESATETDNADTNGGSFDEANSKY